MTLAADSPPTLAPENPLTGAAFDRLYASDIEPELQRHEGDRQKAMNLFTGIWVAGLMLLGLEFALHIDFRIFGVTGVGTAVLAYLPLIKVRNDTKQAVIGALCKPLGMTYRVGGFEPPAFETFLALKLLPKPDDKSVEDYFAGRRGPSDFALCEATLTRGTGKNRSMVFQGQVFRIGFPRKFLGTTVVLRDSGWLNRFECPPGLEKVGLEDPHFEKIFEVFGSDQVEARAILTPVFMEQLLALESAYAGKHLRFGFTAGDLLIAIEGVNRFEIGGMFSTLVSRPRVEGVAHDIGAVFTLIDTVVGA